MFDRLLLALDDSPAGEVATLFAAALARRAGATVHVLHVNERLRRWQRGDLAFTSGVHGPGLRPSGNSPRPGVRADGSVCVSSYRGVPERIVTTALERSADAIVFGLDANRRLGRLFSPQVRERTTRLTALPVLTAPSPLRVSSPPGTAEWTDGLGQAVDALLG